MLTMQLSKRGMALNWLGDTKFEVSCIPTGVSKTYDTFEKAWTVYNQCLAGGFVEADPSWNEPSPQEKARMAREKQIRDEKAEMLAMVSEITGLPVEVLEIVDASTEKLPFGLTLGDLGIPEGALSIKVKPMFKARGMN